MMPERSRKIACAHPGKLGDCLYALPAVKALCELHQTTADFYTSSYCLPLKRLFEAQPYIDNFYVAPNYVLERADMGCQPYYVPMDGSLYYKTYQMGFRRVPDKSIPEFIGQEVGVQVGRVEYALPETMWYLNEQYIVIAPRGATSYRDLFQELINRSPVEAVIVGGKGDADPFYPETKVPNFYDLTGMDFLGTTCVLSRASAFVGIMSSQLCLANGWDMPKVIPHDGKSWDMRHIVDTPSHHYLVNPSADEVLALIQSAL